MFYYLTTWFFILFYGLLKNEVIKRIQGLGIVV